MPSEDDDQRVGGGVEDRADDVGRVHGSSSRLEEDRGEHARAFRDRDRALDDLRGLRRVAQRERLHAEPSSIATVLRPSGICDGLRSPSVPRIERTTGNANPYGITSEPIALSELPRPEHCASTSGIPPAAR